MRRHPFDAISFVFGVIFILLAAAVALPETPLDLIFTRVRWGWVFPLAIIAIGVALLVPVLRPASTDQLAADLSSDQAE